MNEDLKAIHPLNQCIMKKLLALFSVLLMAQLSLACIISFEFKETALEATIIDSENNEAIPFATLFVPEWSIDH